MTLHHVIIALLGYFAGCLNAGYYFVRIVHGKDLRLLGSGTAGARNAGRQYGRWTFSLVFFTDFAKGATLTALALGSDLELAAVAAVAVVVGHIWPIQLGFQGGKGIASALGATLLLAPGLLLWIGISTAIWMLLGQGLTRAGIAGFWLAALGAGLLQQPLPVITAAIFLALLLTISHRKNLRRV